MLPKLPPPQPPELPPPPDASPAHTSYYHGLIYQAHCEYCPLRYDMKVLPDGPIPPKICFVGEGPGRQELIQGKGFVGQSGALLWEWAERAGIHRRDVWVSNAALCKPRPVTLSNGFKITKPEVLRMSLECCRSRLLNELVYVTHANPNAVLVPIGKWAFWALYATTSSFNPKIYSWRGAKVRVDLQGMQQYVNSLPPPGGIRTALRPKVKFVAHL